MFSAPSQGPSNLRVEELGAFNVTVAWDNITSGQNGIIQKYEIKIAKEHNPNLDRICCVGVNEPRIATFSIQPAQKYAVQVCGYTSYHKCGTWSNTGWFHSLPLCKYGYILFYFLKQGDSCL